MTEFATGTRVRFYPGPKSTSTVDATVVGRDGSFLLTKDATGKERKVRPGSCIAI